MPHYVICPVRVSVVAMYVCWPWQTETTENTWVVAVSYVCMLIYISVVSTPIHYWAELLPPFL